MIDIRLSQKESIDLRGFPVPNDATRSVEWFISSVLQNVIDCTSFNSNLLIASTAY